MSVASSIPCIRLPTTSSSTTCCSSSSTTLRLTYNKPYMSLFTIRSSQTEGPIRRPVAPPLREPSPPSPTPPMQPPSTAPPPPPPPKPVSAASQVEDKSMITLEFQRAKAKELQEYFKQKKLEAAATQGPVFGFVAKNEITNGRWAMFGFAVGMLTEYATGSDFVEQIKLILSNLGIVDLD